MGGKTGSRRARRISASGQVPLGLDVPQTEVVPWRSDAVRFVDPAPDSILVGALTLRQFISVHGLEWVDATRKLLRTMDWSSYIARYKPGGREPYHPAGMVGLLMLGFITGRTSLRQLEELARTDLRAWWLTGGVMPDFTSLCRFMLRHSDDLTDATFDQLTQKILAILGAKASAVFVDGTVVQAACSRLHLLKQEAARHAAERANAEAAAHPDDKCLQGKAKLADIALATVTERDAERAYKGRPQEAQVAPTEPEAVVQPLKEGGYAPSYKPSAAATVDRIIVGKQVEASNEVAQVERMLTQAERNVGAPIATMALDAGYNCGEVLKIAEEHGVELLCPEGRTPSGDKPWTKTSPKLSKDKFTFDSEKDCYTCPQGRKLVFDYRCTPSNGKPAYVRYKSLNCRDCPLASQCLSKEAARRTLKRYQHQAAKEALREKMSKPDVRLRYKQRQASIEPVHGEQKHIQGMRRFRRRGLAKARLEYSLHCMAHNLRRYRALRGTRPAASGTDGGRRRKSRRCSPFRACQRPVAAMRTGMRGPHSAPT